MLRGLIGAIALLASAAGCRQTDRDVARVPSAAGTESLGATANPPPPTEGVRLSYWGVGIAPGDGPEGGAAARLEGVLSRLGACLVVRIGDGRPIHPVFPAGKARWDEAAGALIFAGRTYRPGERIVLGGGGVPPRYARESGVELAPCAVSDLWAVIA